MLERFPLLILLAAALLGLSGASRSGRAGSGALALSPAGAAQPSPEPITEGDWAEGTFQSPGAAPSPGTSPEPVSHTRRAANRTALQPGSLHTGAPRPQDGLSSPGKLWSSSTQGPQPPTARQREPGAAPGAAPRPPSSSLGLPQPFPGAGTLQDSPQVTALSSPAAIEHSQVPSPDTSLLTPALDFHPPRTEMAASALPPGAGISLGRAGEGWLPTGKGNPGKEPTGGMLPTGKGNTGVLPTGKGPTATSPTAGVAPARLRSTQSSDAGATASASPAQPAPGELGSVYSRSTQGSPVQFSPLQQEGTGSKGRNSSSAVTKGSAHPAQLPAPHTLPAGTMNSSFWMEAPAPEGSLPSPFQGGSRDGQQPLSLPLTCTKHLPPESNSSSQDTALQGDAAPRAGTGSPGKPSSPESPQPAPSSSSFTQPWISTSKPSPSSREPKEATPALSPGMPTFGNGDLQPWDSVPAGLQPPAASAAAGMQPMGLHAPSSSSSPPGSGSQLQGASVPPVPQGALAGMLQVSTGRRSKPGSLSPAASPVPKTDSPALSPAASPVPSPSGALSHRHQAVPSLVPPSPPELAAPALLAPPAQGAHPGSPTAQPGPGVPREVPAALAQALGHQLRTPPDAAAESPSTARGEPLALLPSSPLLSFVLRSSEGTICLQPVQGSPLPPELPSSSLGGLLSVQQVLAAPNSSVLDLANSQLSPSSLVLVRPVFVLLPRDGAQGLPSPRGDHSTAHLVTSLGTPGSSQGTPGTTSASYPTGKSVGPGAAVSAVPTQQAERAEGNPEPGPANPEPGPANPKPGPANPEPGPANSEPGSANPAPAALGGLSPAVPSAPGHGLEPRMSPTLPSLPRLPEEMQIPAPHPQQATGTALLSLAAEPGTSPVPPELVSTQSLQSSPKGYSTTERAQSSPGAPFLAAKGPRGSPEPAQPGGSTGAAGQGGSVPTPSPAHAPSLPSKAPPRALPSTKALQPPPQRLPGTELLPSPAAPSTSPASVVLPAGQGHSEPTAGSTARPAVPAPATAAPVPSTAGTPGPSKGLELELSPAVPQPLPAPQSPTAAAEQALLPTETQTAPAIPGGALAVLSPAGMAASPPAPAPAPAELSSQPSSAAGAAAAAGSPGTSVSPPATSSPSTARPPLGQQLGLTAAQPGPVPALGGHPRATQAAAAGTALPAAKGASGTARPKGTEPLLLPAPAGQPEPRVVLEPSGQLPAALGSPEGAAGGDAAPSRQLPTQAPVSHPQENVSRPLDEVSPPVAEVSPALEEAAMEPVTGHSSPGTAARAVPGTAAPVPADRLVTEGPAEPAVPGRDPDLDPEPDPEPEPEPEPLPVSPGPQSPRAGSGARTAPGQPGPGAAGMERAEEEEEEEGRTGEVTDGAAEALGTAVTPEPAALRSGWHQSRGLRSDVPALDGQVPRQGSLRLLLLQPGRFSSYSLVPFVPRLAIVSDSCGAGNHSVRLSLSPAGAAAPGQPRSEQPRDTFEALVALQSDSSRALLQLHSCCVTPSASPGAAGAQCCLFRRLPLECRHIQLLGGGSSRATSFSIQLFQMLNHSVAYLHCELRVCLPGQPGCEQECLESVEPLAQPSDRTSHGSLLQLVSLGPVWRMNNRFLYKPEEGAAAATLLPMLLGALAGCAALGAAFMGLWLHQRQRAKPSRYPPPGEFHGL
ncbi:unnamed protein product [Coccothraustes coccothraustes]